MARALSARQDPQLGVGERAGLLQDREGADDGQRHALAADAEVLERALVWAPQ
jgi:hypothetical protein